MTRDGAMRLLKAHDQLETVVAEPWEVQLRPWGYLGRVELDYGVLQVRADTSPGARYVVSLEGVATGTGFTLADAVEVLLGELDRYPAAVRAALNTEATEGP